MNYATKIILFATTLCIPFIAQCSEKNAKQQSVISVRLATLDDMEQINAISFKQYHNDFKPMWKEF